MAGKYLMGIDEGTTGSRACIFDLQGNLLGSSYAEYGITSPRPGWYEQDCEFMAAVIYEACQGAIKKAGIDPKEIAAVGLSSQGAAFVPVDKDDKIVRPCIGWQDTRGAEFFDEIRSIVPEEELYKIAGTPISTPWSLSKILWIKKYEPQNFEKTACFALHQDFFLTALGVKGHYVDISSASRFGFFDVDRHKYSEKLLASFGIPEEKLPQVVAGGSKVGEITKSISERTGLAEGTPICVGAMDVNASVLGLGVVKEGMAGTILGTYGACVAFSPRPVRDPNGRMVVMGNVGTWKWTMEGSSLAAASSYRWYRDTFGDLEVATGKILGEDPYELINQQIAGGKPGARGLLFIPHLASAGSPRNDENARGLLLGLTLAHTKADVARAVMEGITLEIRDIITAIQRAGVEIRECRITGGGTKSPLWNQMQADIYGRPVATVQTSDTGALGAAMLAGIGAGIFNNVEEAAEQMVRVVRSYEPNPENVKVYDELYDVYVSTFEGLAGTGVYKKLAAFQARLVG